jgi:hypothetical protein
VTTLVDGIGQHLAAQISTWDYTTTGALDPDKTPVVIAGSPDEPDTVVVVTTYPGGPEPDTRNGWEFPRLQVRVRAVDPLAALELDRAAYDVLQAAPGTYPVTLPNGQTVQDCYALQSEAQPLGQDANGRWEFVRNYQLTL